MTNIMLQINKKVIYTGFFLAVMVIAGVISTPCPVFCAERENDVVRAVRKISPAVVNISSEYEIQKKSNPFSAYRMDPWLENFFRDFLTPEFERREKRSSLGSGVIIDGDRNYVLTNAHVVEKASTITISLNDKREFKAALVGMDPDSDLAVLKIETDEKLPSVQMGDSDDIMIGESVIAIGNPFGFSHTVTTGVISAVKRSIRADDRIFHEFIQTDASINPGNSGGPLLNINAELIGINTAIYAQAQGIGFAIPINRAKRIISDLINYGEVVRVWIGLSIQPIDQNLASYLGIANVKGVIVTAVETGSPAENAHVQEGDIIVSIDGDNITGNNDYRSKINNLSVDQSVSLKILRGDKYRRLTLKTAAFPLDQALALADRLMGLTVSGIDDRTRSKYGIESRRGVLITKLRRHTYLYRIGVRPGDIIHQIDEKQIISLDDFKESIIKYRNKPSVVMMIQRDRHLYYINVTIEDNKS